MAFLLKSLYLTEDSEITPFLNGKSRIKYEKHIYSYFDSMVINELLKNGKFDFEEFLNKLLNTRVYVSDPEYDDLRIGKQFLYSKVKIKELEEKYPEAVRYLYIIAGNYFNPSMFEFNIKNEKESDEYIKNKLTNRYNEIMAVYNFVKQSKGKNGLMGKIIFGDERGLIEPNTQAEDNLIVSLNRHVEDNVGMGERQVNLLVSFLQNGFYKDFIKPPGEQNIYRGMSTNKKILSGLLRIPMDEIPKRGKKVLDDALILKPRYKKIPTTSWSKNKERAFAFSERNMNDVMNMGLLLYARSTDNVDKLFDLETYYKEVNGEFSNEKEVIGLGNISVYMVEWRSF